jgi:hypothetical protein
MRAGRGAGPLLTGDPAETISRIHPCPGGIDRTPEDETRDGVRAGSSPRQSLLANAMVLSSAFSACRESSRVCCTTIGTSDSTSIA